MSRRPATFVRRRRGEIEELVCTLLAGEPRPLSAYDIAERASGTGRRIVAAQIYRTLARLVQQRRVLRIEMLGAYMTCADPANLCLVCLGCRDVRLIRDDAVRPIQSRAAKCRFHLTPAPIEAGGLCDACSNRQRASSAGGSIMQPLASTGNPASGATRAAADQG
jgi:Fur family zinc uptake transcriptional regulator